MYMSGRRNTTEVIVAPSNRPQPSISIFVLVNIPCILCHLAAGFLLFSSVFPFCPVALLWLADTSTNALLRQPSPYTTTSTSLYNGDRREATTKKYAHQGRAPG